MHPSTISFALVKATIYSDTQRAVRLLPLLLAVLCLAPFRARAAEPEDHTARFVEIAEKALRTARANLATNLNETAWHCARALFERAEFATNHTQRANLANDGIALCRRLVAAQPKSVGGHFYLGMNLGQLARTKMFGAIPLVDEMEGAFEKSRAMDEQFEFAGPDRNLGLLYLEAPGWPVSVGNRTKARKHLVRAVELAPDFPENRLNLLDALLRWGDGNAATTQREALVKLLPAARKKLTGDTWAASWGDWEKRWRRLAPAPDAPHRDR